MRYIILLVALLSCSEEELTICKKHLKMSDALPVQFWDADDETFNEKSICGISKQDCFCLPFECDDTISGQFDEDYDGFDLGIYSNSGLIDSFPLEEVSNGVWGFSFSPSDYSGLCNEQIQLKVTSPDPVLPSLSTFTNRGSGTNWTTGGSTPTFVISGAFAQTKLLSTPFAGIAGLNYQINYDIDVVTMTGSELQDVYIALMDEDEAVIPSTIGQIGQYGVGNYTGVFNFISTERFYYIGVYARLDDSGVGTTSGRVNSLSYTAQANVVIKKSDCLDVRESHDCTKLIEYSNESDFDGIVYSDISPRPTFYLRVPAMFFEEDNPQEQEDLVLSNGVIVTLRQGIQEKRLLETGYMPNYMHKKLQKVLMHESITIDGDGWKRRDPYESNPIKKYSLKRASVLLTKYNSVLKNTI